MKLFRAVEDDKGMEAVLEARAVPRLRADKLASLLSMADNKLSPLCLFALHRPTDL